MSFLGNLFKGVRRSSADILVDEFVRLQAEGDGLTPASYIAQFPEHAIELVAAFKKRGFRVATPASELQPEPTPEVDTGPQRPSWKIPEESQSLTSLAGKTFAGYQLDEQIGVGGMARVYKAWDPQHDRFIAVKTLQSVAEITADQMRRLQREGTVHSGFHHRNIVEVYDAGIVNDIPFLAMEYIETGRNLHSVLEQNQGGLPPRQAAELLMNLAEALAYSHARGVIHRDVKPANVMMIGETPKLTDFGLAFVQDDLRSRISRTNEMVGTLAFMAPEQMHGDKNPTPAWDIYALGAMMYEMLTGALPFTAGSPPELAQLVFHEDPQPPTRLVPDLNRDLEDVCIKCMEKTPAKRYASAGDFADDLGRFLRGRKVTAPRVHWRIRRFRRLVRTRGGLVVAMIITALALAGAGAAVVGARTERALADLREGKARPSDAAGWPISLLRKAARHDDPANRIVALAPLAKHGDKGFAVLVGMVDDPNPDVRAHLASSLVVHSHPAVAIICRGLLQDPSPMVVAAAIRLSDGIDDPSLTPLLEQVAFTQNKVARRFAVLTLMSKLGGKAEGFSARYLQCPGLSRRMELLERMERSQTPPPMAVLIDRLEHTVHDSEREAVRRCLVLFTDVDHGNEVEAWRQWWEYTRREWQARPTLVVYWAAATSQLRRNDILWKVNEKEPPYDARKAVGANTHTVIRGETLFTIHQDVGRYRARLFLVGTIHGLPVGRDAVRKRMAAALAEPVVQ
ncbi:MAG: protein kinase [Lentisphaeria bacterium]|nr:protein kinase [Lentisphaeria bacterium]